MSYYSPGDEVIYTPKGCGAKILRDLPGDEYIVEFDDKTLIPPQMQIPGKYLIPKPPPTLWGGYQVDVFGHPITPDDFRGFPNWNNKETHCPRCGNPWTASQGFRHTYYDCLKCNLKKEDA